MEDHGEKPTKEEKIDALLHAYKNMNYFTPYNAQYRRRVEVMEYILKELGVEVDG